MLCKLLLLFLSSISLSTPPKWLVKSALSFPAFQAWQAKPLQAFNSITSSTCTSLSRSVGQQVDLLHSFAPTSLLQTTWPSAIPLKFLRVGGCCCEVHVASRHATTRSSRSSFLRTFVTCCSSFRTQAMLVRGDKSPRTP